MTDDSPTAAARWRSLCDRALRQREALRAIGGEDPNAIAVVGMACRFPGAGDIEAYWRNLRDGVESVSAFSREEAVANGADPDLVGDPDYVLAGAVLEDVDAFDAKFFGINPKEAAAMDPQHRVFLECAWNALEHAGYAPEQCPRSTAVFGGCGLATRHIQDLAESADLNASLAVAQLGVGSYADFLCTRVSFKLGLQGPGLDMQTACSTSLVAVAMGWQALRTQQCDMVLAGGVSIRYPRRTGYLYTPGEILSPDGHCRPFDAMAMGTVAGEGVGVVVLKRLADAIADGDQVYCVVRGAALNNDGDDKVSFYATSVEAQADVVLEGMAHAGVEPRAVSYVECHGTATPLGDPIEIASLDRAFRAATADRGFCAIGSVKSNFGHADAAAGVAGVIKTALALRHRTLPASLHYRAPNPEIDFEATPFHVNATTTDWSTDGPRYAGINSFGIGGTNAHVVLQEAPELPPTDPGRAAELLVVSAKSEAALEQSAARLAAHLRAAGEPPLADVAFTTQVGRAAFTHRRCAVGADAEELAAALEASDRRRPAVVEGDPPPVVFVFPGQGAQHVDMGRALYDGEPVYREALDQCAALLEPHLGTDLRAVLYPAETTETAHEAAAQQLQQTRLTQPALFAVEYATAQLWMSLGVRPAAMAGHSVGELVAATLAGVFALADAVRIVAARGAMMQDLPAGSMLSVPLSEADVQEYVGAEVSVAAVNGPASCVLAGPNAAIASVSSALEAKGLPCRALKTSHAFHSAMMQPIVAPFAALVGEVERSPAQIPCVSTVTGDWIDARDWVDPEYWARNLRQPVRFYDAARALVAEPRVVLEVGPGRTLSALIKQHAARAGKRTVLTSLRHPQDPPENDLRTWLASVGRLWCEGIGVDWRAFWAGRRRRRVPLPGYPFERVPFAIARTGHRTPAAAASAAGPARAPVAARLPLERWFSLPTWVRSAWPPVEAAVGEGGWLILDDGLGLGAAVEAALDRAGAAGPRVKLAFDAAMAGDATAWQRSLAPLAGAPALTILHLWGVMDADAKPDAEGAQRRGFHALVAIIRALADASFHRVRLCAVTNDLHGIAGEPARLVERATSIGVCRVASQELPHWLGQAVDVDWRGDGTSADRVARRLLQEAGDFAAPPVVAHRGAARFAQTVVPQPMPAVGGDERPWQSAGATYLITGGLGGIGLEFARFLAQAGAPHLVLTSRSGLPPRAEWDAASAAGGTVGGAVDAVRALEACGATVTVVAADVARRTDMWRALEEVAERGGEVRGVFHSAGVSDATALTELDAAAADRVLQAKLKGTLVLAQLLQPEKLDFFVVCSSLSALLGGLGAAAYAGANAFLDAFAQMRAAGGDGAPPVIAVDWDTWRDVGLITRIEDPAERAAAEAATADAIAKSEAPELFARILARPLPQVAVSTTDLGERMRRSAARTEAAAEQTPDSASPGAAAGSGEHAAAAPATEAAPAHDASAMEQVILQCVQQLMGIDDVEAEDSFFELGVDSLIAHRMAVRLREPLGMTVPLRAVLETGSPRALAAYLSDLG